MVRWRAPMWRPQGEVMAAMWISGPAKRLPKSRFREMGDQVKAAAAQASQQIARMG